MKLSFAARVACHRLRRHLDWRIHPKNWARNFASADDFPIAAAARTSPLKRSDDGPLAAHAEAKTKNLQIASAKLNGLRIGPGEVFSFCRIIGKTTRRGGYLPAMEMHDRKLRAEVGGGLCQLANLLFLLALDINAEILERHRHSFDLFPDVERTVPFGCGATVIYNYVDFQFQNTLPFPVLLAARVEPPVLRAEIRSAQPLPFTTKIVETDHRFFRRDGQIFRANRLWKELHFPDSSPTQRELLFVNECNVLYPAEHLVNADE